MACRRRRPQGRRSGRAVRPRRLAILAPASGTHRNRPGGCIARRAERKMAAREPPGGWRQRARPAPRRAPGRRSGRRAATGAGRPRRPAGGAATVHAARLSPSRQAGPVLDSAPRPAGARGEVSSTRFSPATPAEPAPGRYPAQPPPRTLVFARSPAAEPGGAKLARSDAAAPTSAPASPGSVSPALPARPAPPSANLASGFCRP
jgi:hypothetical protein